jgi:hypothetical protein
MHGADPARALSVDLHECARRKGLVGNQHLEGRGSAAATAETRTSWTGGARPAMSVCTCSAKAQTLDGRTTGPILRTRTGLRMLVTRPVVQKRGASWSRSGSPNSRR